MCKTNEFHIKNLASKKLLDKEQFTTENSDSSMTKNEFASLRRHESNEDRKWGEVGANFISTPTLQLENS